MKPTEKGIINIDADHKLPVFIICDFCKNIIKKGKTCNAFPKGIPNEIIDGKNLHQKPLPKQDNDIVFEKQINL